MAGMQASRDEGLGQTDGVADLWGPTSWEARLLAGSLRSAPVTVLHGAGAAEQHALLTQGVLPLLARRSGDHAVQPHNRVLPFPERRSQLLGHQATRGFELALHLHDWQQQHLRPLHVHIDAACAELRAHGGGPIGPDGDFTWPDRVLLLLEGFEDSLDDPSAEAQAFWADLLDRQAMLGIDVHLLLATEDAHAPRFRPLAKRLPGFADHMLRLGSAIRGTPLRLAQPPPDPLRQADDRLPEAQRFEDLQQVVQRVAEPTCPQAVAAVRPAAAVLNESIGADTPAALIEPLFANPAPTRPIPLTRAWCCRPLAVTALGAIAVLTLAGIWWLAPASRPPVAAERLEPALRAAATAAATVAAKSFPSPVPPAPPVPSAPQGPSLAIEPGDALRAALAPLRVLDLRGGRPGLLAALGSNTPALAIVRYDALQRVADDPRAATLHLVSPLFTEPVQLWVRAASPLQHLQEIRGRRLDTGPADGADALTATALHQAMFGTAPRAISSPRASQAARPSRGQSEIVFRVGAAALPGGPPGAWRALTLAERDPSTARALRAYLPVVGTGTPPGRTPGVMAFLAVQGGDAAARETLARSALSALCTAWPQLRAADAATWSTVEPGSTLPAGRPYAAAAASPPAVCDPAQRTAMTSTGRATATVSGPPAGAHSPSLATDQKGPSQ